MKTNLLTLLVILTAPHLVAIAGNKDKNTVKPLTFAEIKKELGFYNKKEITFSVILAIDTSKEFPQAISSRSKNHTVFSPRSSKNIYIAIPNRELEKKLVKPYNKQKVMVSGKVRSLTISNKKNLGRKKEGYLIKIKKLELYYPAIEILTEKADFPKYRKANSKDITFDIQKYIGLPVHLVLRLKSIKPLTQKGRVRLPLAEKDWLLVTHQGRSHESVYLYVAKTLAENINFLKNLAIKDPMHIYGRATLVPYGSKDRAAIIVDKAANHPVTDEIPQKELEQPVAQAGKNEKEEQKPHTPSRPELRISAIDLSVNPGFYLNRKICFSILFKGSKFFPSQNTEQFTILKGKQWQQVITKETPLANITLLFDSKRSTVSIPLKKTAIKKITKFHGVLRSTGLGQNIFVIAKIN